MRLYLAVAVLMLAFVAYTEAQDHSIEDKLTGFGQQITELGRSLAEKTRAGFDQISESEFASNTRNWFNDQFSKLKAKFDEVNG